MLLHSAPAERSLQGGSPDCGSGCGGWIRAGQAGHIEPVGCVCPADEVDWVNSLEFAAFHDGVDDAVAPGAMSGVAPE